MAKTRIFPPRRNAHASRHPLKAAEMPAPTPPAPEPAPKPEPEPEPSPDRAASGRVVVDRIGVPIGKSGAFDLDAMRPATRARFDDALRKTKIPSAVSSDSNEYRPVAAMAVDAVVSLQVMAATVLRCTPQEARHFAWNGQQRAVLADQLSAVLARHPQWMQNAPEALLGATYCGFLVGSLQAIRAEREGGNRGAAPSSVSDPPNLASASLQ